MATILRLPCSFAAAALLALAAAPWARADDEDTQAPYITTPPAVVERMLALAGTGPGDLVVDLGSGDGRIVIAAAARFGARGRGIELEPSLVRLAREEARRAGVAGRVAFEQGDVLESDLFGASVVTVYLLGSLMNRLQPKFLAQLKPGTRIVSHAFVMSGWRPDRVETMRVPVPHAGQGGTSTLHLWVVPAQARGVWRSDAAAEPPWRLRIAQNYQDLDVEASRGGDAVPITDLQLSGAAIRWRSGDGMFRGRIEGRRMHGTLQRPQGDVPLVLTRRDN